jgi:hypothetical protein
VFSRIHAGVGFAVLLTCSFCACSSSKDEDAAKPRQCLAPSPAVDLTMPEVSFNKAIVPLVQSNCSLPACHADAKVSLGIYLPMDGAEIYKAVRAPATSNLKLDFVKPGAPGDSYLMHKLDGTHCALDKDCVKGSCGQEMPPAATLSVDDRNVFRRWIAQGAKNN